MCLIGQRGGVLAKPARNSGEHARTWWKKSFLLILSGFIVVLEQSWGADPVETSRFADLKLRKALQCVCVCVLSHQWKRVWVCRSGNYLSYMSQEQNNFILSSSQSDFIYLYSQNRCPHPKLSFSVCGLVLLKCKALNDTDVLVCPQVWKVLICSSTFIQKNLISLSPFCNMIS